jgi:signal transduction histidine kinase
MTFSKLGRLFEKLETEGQTGEALSARTEELSQKLAAIEARISELNEAIPRAVATMRQENAAHAETVLKTLEQRATLLAAEITARQGAPAAVPIKPAMTNARGFERVRMATAQQTGA